MVPSPHGVQVVLPLVLTHALGHRSHVCANSYVPAGHGSQVDWSALGTWPASQSVHPSTEP